MVTAELISYITLGLIVINIVSNFAVYKWKSEHIAALKGTNEELRTLITLFETKEKLKDQNREMEVKKGISVLEEKLVESEKESKLLREQLAKFKEIEKKNSGAIVKVRGFETWENFVRDEIERKQNEIKNN